MHEKLEPCLYLSLMRVRRHINDSSADLIQKHKYNANSLEISKVVKKSEKIFLKLSRYMKSETVKILPKNAKRPS